MSSIRYKVQRQFNLIGGKTDVQWVSYYDKASGLIGYDSLERLALELKPADAVSLAVELNKCKGSKYWANPVKTSGRSAGHHRVGE